MSTQKHNQKGQTLVETVVGIFVLTIGISTAIGLANSVFISTTSAVKQLQAVGLAREGIEAVFSMRATNWLRAALGPCYDYPTGTNGAACRNSWLNPVGNSGTTDGLYDIRGTGVGGRPYTLRTDYTAADAGEYWQFVYQPGANPDYKLYYDPTAATGLLYTTNSAAGAPSGYYRQILIEEDTVPPYDQATIGPRLKVSSRVWWTDRGCATSATWPTTGNCRVELVTFLTNWRNF